MACCGDNTVSSSRTVKFSDNPELFDIRIIANHSPSLMTLVGKSGKNYSQRKDGDKVAILLTDIEAEPDKFHEIP